MHETRERILAAAAAIVAEDPETRPSVRAVAARAGVGASTLRHHFPTQRELFDALLRSAFETQYPDGPIHDVSIPARDRLVECLTCLLTPVGEGEQARQAWMQMLRSFGGAAKSTRSESAFAAMALAAGDRIGSWLKVLETEGAMPAGDHARRVAFLGTVIDGLAVGRALPSGTLDRESERGVLEDAAEAVLSPPGP